MSNFGKPENVKKCKDDQMNGRKKYHQILVSKTTEYYCSYAYNTDCSILFAGTRSGRIQVFGFNSNLKLIQNIPHSYYRCHNIISNLTFIRKTKQLLSSSTDNLVIWKQNQNNQWAKNQKVSIERIINSIILNQNEDLLIIGCLGVIMFWKNENQSWICSQRIDVPAQHLSINQSSTKLISGFSNALRVIEPQPDQQWIVTQSILGNFSERLCFINDNQFICQLKRNVLELYCYNNEKEKFILDQQVITQASSNCPSFFPAQYIKDKNILMVKHGENLNFFGIDQKGEIYLSQSIHHSTFGFQGRLTDNGKQLILFDQGKSTIEWWCLR